MTCETPVLSIEGLHIALHSRSCPDRQLVNDVSFTVERGRVTGLIGESGCGKSLTCLAAMGLLPDGMSKTRGRVRLAGTSLEPGTSGWRSFRGRQAAMILQNPMSCFDPVFTVGHHIRETLRAHGLQLRQHLADIRATLVELGFEQPDEILKAYPFQLSGGMLQRIMVSLALLLEVELLIADEPTTDLDVVVQSRLLSLIDGLRRKKNIGVLLVTHDLSVIARLADEVLVMRDGEVIERGAVGEVFLRPRQAYTRLLLGAHFSLYGLDYSPEAVA